MKSIWLPLFVFLLPQAYAAKDAARFLEQVKRESQQTAKHLERIEESAKWSKLPSVQEQVEWALNQASRFVAEKRCTRCEKTVAEVEASLSEYLRAIEKAGRLEPNNLKKVIAEAQWRFAIRLIGSTFEQFEVEALNSPFSGPQFQRENTYGRFTFNLTQYLIQQLLSGQPLSNFANLAATIFKSPHTSIQCNVLQAAHIQERDMIWLLGIANEPQYKLLRPCLIGKVLGRLSDVGQMALADRVWSSSSESERARLIENFKHSLANRSVVTSDDFLLLDWMLKQRDPRLTKLVIEQAGKHGLEDFPELVAKFFTSNSRDPLVAERGFDNPALVEKLGDWLCVEGLRPVLNKIIQFGSGWTLSSVATRVLTGANCLNDMKLARAYIEHADHPALLSYVGNVLPDLERPEEAVSLLLERLDLQNGSSRELLIAIFHHPHSGQWEDLLWRELGRLRQANPAALEHMLRQLLPLQHHHSRLKRMGIKVTSLRLSAESMQEMRGCESLLKTSRSKPE